MSAVLVTRTQCDHSPSLQAAEEQLRVYGDRRMEQLDEDGSSVRAIVYGPGSLHAFESHGLLVAVAGYPERVERPVGQPAFSSPTTAEAVGKLYISAGGAALDSLTGEFGVVIWDARAQQLIMQTDNFGTSSLFARYTENGTYVSTEVAPLLALGGPTEFDELSLTDILASRFLAGTRSVWRGIRQVTPGWRCVVDARGSLSETAIERFTLRTPDHSLTIGATTAAMANAMRANLGRLRDGGVSDVAVPLSGGIDSSLVAAFAKEVFPRVTAITFAIDDFPNPELSRSQEVARRLGIPLHVLQVHNVDVARLFPWIMSRLQEPPLHYNNAVLVRMLEDIRGIATVVLAGDFASLWGSNMVMGVRRQMQRKERLRSLPGPVLAGVAALLRASGQPRLRRAANTMLYDIPTLIRRSTALRITPEAARAFPSHAQGWPSQEAIERTYEFDASLEDAGLLWAFRTISQPIVRRNARFSSALGLRYHYPLKDVAALDLVTKLPPDLKWSPQMQKGKPILRALCTEMVGADVAEWPKLGFPTPELAWMQGPLADKLHSALADDSPLAPWIDVGHLRELPVAPNQQTIWTAMTLSEVLRQGNEIMKH